MSSITPITQAQAVDLQPKKEAPSPSVSRFSFAELKKTGVWAWETSVQSVKNAAGSLQGSIKRVASYVQEFFSTKFQTAKNFVVNIPENISLKLGARAYAPRIAALEAQLAQERANHHQPLVANALPQIPEEEPRPIFPAHDEALDSEEAAPMLKAEEPAPAAPAAPKKEEATKPIGWLSYFFTTNYKK